MHREVVGFRHRKCVEREREDLARHLSDVDGVDDEKAPRPHLAQSEGEEHLSRGCAHVQQTHVSGSCAVHLREKPLDDRRAETVVPEEDVAAPQDEHRLAAVLGDEPICG